MSSTEDASETQLKAGHPPAVKVGGGMRITQHKPPGHEKPTPEPKKEEEDNEEEEQPVSVPQSKPHLVISGVVAKGDADFPTEAVQAFHSKPLPAHEYRPASKPTIIQQPRK